MTLDLRPRDALWGEDVTSVMRDALDLIQEGSALRGGPNGCRETLEMFERRYPRFARDLRSVVALALNRARL